MRHHETVLQHEAVAALNVRPSGRYVDATFGRGGHARAILDTLGAVSYTHLTLPTTYGV